MIQEARSPSLKRRLLLTLLLPLFALLLALGALATWFVQQIVENSSDRVLSGSLQAISETLAVQDGHLTLDLPPSALGMLENADRDNVYYNVSYKGRLVTGYQELAIPDAKKITVEDITFRDATFHGVPIRVATEARLVPQLDSPVIVQVAETVTHRNNFVERMLTALAGGETLLLAVVALFVVFGVDWGLRPLSKLQTEIEKRMGQADADFGPLPLASVPREAVSFVSAFNALLGHVETSIETLKRFTSDASHQLRAPLAVIRTHVEVLNRKADGSGELNGPLSDIHAAVRALQHLIVQLISLAKADRPNANHETSWAFDLVECTAAAARHYAADALARQMELSFESDCEYLQVTGNVTFANEMISNLLDNAVRYGRPGGHIDVRINGSSGALEIQDNGPGIAPEELERVFERFYRSPRTLNSEGSGLGLSIVQALGKRMNASVKLETVPGEGLNVVVQFQMAKTKFAA
jgi:two-component system sensor histidine kinase TctE